MLKVLRKIHRTGELALWSRFKELNRNHHDLTYLFWECTLNCNFYCKHCGSSAGRKLVRGELTEEEIKNVFKDVANNFNPKNIMLAVTGGEPLVRRDLFSVMKYASELGFPWGMVTNGFLVNDYIVNKMKDTGMTTVVVSIDGVGETHDTFRGKIGAYEKAINAVKLMAEADFLVSLQITTCVDKNNIDQLEKMYEVFLPLGITSWRIMNVDPIGRALDYRDELLDGKGLKRLLSFIKEKRAISPIDITYGCAGFLGEEFEKEVRSQYFVCNTGINVGSILHNGDIFVCPNVPCRKDLIQGNVRKDKFTDVWKNGYKQFRDKYRTSNEECIGCEHWDNCLGGAFHLWNFDQEKQTYCHLMMMEEDS